MRRVIGKHAFASPFLSEDEGFVTRAASIAYIIGLTQEPICQRCLAEIGSTNLLVCGASRSGGNGVYLNLSIDLVESHLGNPMREHDLSQWIKTGVDSGLKDDGAYHLWGLVKGESGSIMNSTINHELDHQANGMYYDVVRPS